jgi:endonuclease/exonuclease/phosphatase (EEP) superfamily protein YafD
LSRYVRGAGVCASNLTHATWPEWLGPFGVPIDHIFLKRGVRLLSIATVSGTGSDHKALLATISVL